jgi:hypothetical protein
MAKASAATTSAAEAKWAKRVARFERSGLSIRTFAAREGLKAGSLSFWKWKLAQRKSPRPGTDCVAPLRFVELTTKAVRTPAAAGCFEVVLSSGRTVRVPGGFDAAELARQVGVLEEARP